MSLNRLFTRLSLIISGIDEIRRVFYIRPHLLLQSQWPWLQKAPSHSQHRCWLSIKEKAVSFRPHSCFTLSPPRYRLFWQPLCSSHCPASLFNYLSFFALALNHLSSFFFRYLFILSLSKFKYCSFSFSILFLSFSLCNSRLHLLLLQISQATVWASSRLSLAPSRSPSLPLFPLSEWRERIPYAPSVAPRFTIARAQNWLEFLAVLEKAGISRRRPRPTWHRMPPFPLTGTPPADTAVAESWEQWGPGNLHALLPSPLVYKLSDPDLNSGWDVCKNYGCIFLYLLTLSGSPTTPPPLYVC